MFQDFVFVMPDKASLLGAPLTEGPSLNDAVYARCGELSRAIGRFNPLPAHNSLTILKSSFSAPKIMHTLRCSPCFGNEALEKVDSLLRIGLCTILTLPFQTPVDQASLPVTAEDIGILGFIE